jgi:Uma2 family endonuclease
MKRVSTVDYLSGDETLRRQELEFGTLVREPAPRYGHQAVVTRLTVLLDAAVRQGPKGIVCVSPLDVVLDATRALVLQPDLLYVAAARIHIVRDRVYGAPDLVVEVLSAATERRDRQVKVALYRTYGVGECWLVDASARRVECLPFRAPARHRTFRGADPIQSAVLGSVRFTVDDMFESMSDIP